MGFNAERRLRTEASQCRGQTNLNFSVIFQSKIAHYLVQDFLPPKILQYVLLKWAHLDATSIVTVGSEGICTSCVTSSQPWLGIPWRCCWARGAFAAPIPPLWLCLLLRAATCLSPVMPAQRLVGLHFAWGGDLICLKNNSEKRIFFSLTSAVWEFVIWENSVRRARVTEQKGRDETGAS